MVKPGGQGPLWGAAGKVGYALSCVVAALVLAVSGFSFFVVREVASIGGSNAIASGPSVGEQNILLMGLESRTYWNGQVLPASILSQLHAGSEQGVLYDGVGGNATNTLILIHVPAGGQKAVAFSIPRDDWVTFPTPYDGQSQGKIDQAYGDAMAEKENQLRTQDPGMSADQVAEQGNEAGQLAAVDTVEAVTGVHVDHFAEVNLFGFYELAKVFGGVEVCLNHPVPLDSYSGFYATHAGLQHLDAKMALAFVRQRHGLTNGDLDRTHRQQAFLDSIMQQLRSEGMLDDFTKLTDLLSVAKQYVLRDKNWDLLEFATQMHSLSPGNMVFHTLPVAGYPVIDGQDVNQINVPYIQQVVHDAFYPPAPSASSGASPSIRPTVKADPAQATVDVYNGGQTPGLASQVSAALTRKGYKPGTVQNGTATATTQVLYGTGEQANAANIAAKFGVTATASATVAAGHVEVLLGADATAVPAGLGGPAASPSSSASSVPASDSNGAQGGAVSAKNGIPCVD